jgi:Holliday junction resolvase-like predicted endonuclease
MNAFERVVSMLLEREGYWVKPNYKVHLTKEEKRTIGRHSSPRWEIDLIAYKAKNNTILAVECKSYLDSRGVIASGFIGENKNEKNRYKLFNEPILRDTVFNRMRIQLEDLGLVSKNPNIQLCLAVGKFANDDHRNKIMDHFENNSWMIFDDHWMQNRLENISKSSYENDVTSIVSKILLRD